MSFDRDRRDILKLMAVGGVVFASGLAGAAAGRRRKSDAGAESEFFFLQLSDTHWGYSGVANPQADVTLPRAIETINSAGAQPDFIVFTGDLTHTTDDAAVRRKRMTEFRRLAAGLAVKDLRFLPGEHDAARTRAARSRSTSAPRTTPSITRACTSSRWTTSPTPKAPSGRAQIDWLARDLKKAGRDRRIVVLAHRPLFDLYPAVGMVDEGRREGHRRAARATRTSRSSTGTSTRSITTRPSRSRTTPPGRWSSRCRRPGRCRRRCRPRGTPPRRSRGSATAASPSTARAPTSPSCRSSARSSATRRLQSPNNVILKSGAPSPKSRNKQRNSTTQLYCWNRGFAASRHVWGICETRPAQACGH